MEENLVGLISASMRNIWGISPDKGNVVQLILDLDNAGWEMIYTKDHHDNDNKES